MSNTAMTKAEQNALSVSYDVLGTHVVLDLDFVKKYLVRGQPEKISDQEIVFFMNTCAMQKLNPLVSGEVYCIKFGNEPAQLVVGKGAYLRRAFEHPDYIRKEDGIVVLRGDQVLQKEGCCLYPGEQLIGGWCRVHYMRNGSECTAFKEVALAEYDKGQANWKTKPATMVNKVAVSQCVREAFPKDYEGLYSEEEMVASGAIPVQNYATDPATGEVLDTEIVDADPIITQEERQAMLDFAWKEYGGKKLGSTAVVRALKTMNIESSYEMTRSQVEEVKKMIADEKFKKSVAAVAAAKAALQPEEKSDGENSSEEAAQEE